MLVPSPTVYASPSPTDNMLVPSPIDMMVPSPTDMLVPSPIDMMVPSPTHWRWDSCCSDVQAKIANLSMRKSYCLW